VLGKFEGAWAVDGAAPSSHVGDADLEPDLREALVVGRPIADA
jgi:hypothetical protein